MERCRSTCGTLAERINQGMRQAEAAMDRADELAAERLAIGGIVSRRLTRAAGRCVSQIMVSMDEPGDDEGAPEFLADPFDLSPGDRAWAGMQPVR